MEAQKENGTAVASPRFQEVMAHVLTSGIMDPAHVMTLVKLPDDVVEKLEIDVTTKTRAQVCLTELRTILRVRYRYDLDAELVAGALYHLARGFNVGPIVVAYYWPETSPVVFSFKYVHSGRVALVVAPRVEEP